MVKLFKRDRGTLRITAIVLAVILALACFAGCGKKGEGQKTPENAPSAPQQTQDQSQSEAQEGQKTPESGAEAQPGDKDPAEDEKEPENAPEERYVPDEDGYYYDVENVVLYLNAYGRLPGNYLTKKEAEKLGWSGGTPERYKEGAAIGGDNFGNREGLLPKANGRKYYECDIDTLGKKERGAKRLIFSSDGLYFYTDDHYDSFTELSVDEEGKIVWMN